MIIILKSYIKFLYKTHFKSYKEIGVCDYLPTSIKRFNELDCLAVYKSKKYIIHRQEFYNQIKK